MKNIFINNTLALALLLASTSSFAALKNFTITTADGSQPLSYEIGEKIVKGPIAAGATQQLTVDELALINGMTSTVKIIIPSGTKMNCSPIPITFDGNVVVKGFWQSGNFNCDVNAYSGK